MLKLFDEELAGNQCAQFFSAKFSFSTDEAIISFLRECFLYTL